MSSILLLTTGGVAFGQGNPNTSPDPSGSASMRNSRVPANSQSAPTLPCHVRRRPGSTSPSLALSFGDGLPGIASVSDTVLPGWSSPLIEGSDGFHSG